MELVPYLHSEVFLNSRSLVGASNSPTDAKKKMLSSRDVMQEAWNLLHEDWFQWLSVVNRGENVE